MKTDLIIHGDSFKSLRTLPDGFIHCCVTSPPYYGLRDYGVDGQIGRESTPEQYILRLVEVFREVYRVLRQDGTLWLNISDTYCGTGNKGNSTDPKYPKGRTGQNISLAKNVPKCKPKDLIGIPWMLAFALRDEGWYLRNDIIWFKTNPMPENVRDRCTRTYEHVFLLTKSKKYYFDSKVISEPIAKSTAIRMKSGRSESNKYAEGIDGQKVQGLNKPKESGSVSDECIPATRNKRDVWQISTASYKGNHFATFPLKLAEICILAGSPVDGIVLDPFLGSGTTAVVAKQNNRHYIGIEINEEYCKLANERIRNDKLK